MDFLYKESECGRTLLEWLERMNDEIVDRLVAYREELNKTQQDIANATGFSVAEIERIEKKEEKPPLWKLQKYAESLGLDINFDIAKTEEREGKLPLPVGHSDYREVSTQFCYVDKTMLIKEILDENSKVTLFTRPRRFGKSLNMDMLKVLLLEHFVVAMKRIREKQTHKMKKLNIHKHVNVYNEYLGQSYS